MAIFQFKIDSGFSSKNFLLFFIFCYLLIKLFKADCLSYDLVDGKKCSLCSVEFFNSNRDGSQNVNLFDCKPKQKDIKYKKSIFVMDKGCNQNCLGTKEDPFPSLLSALYFIVNEIEPFLYSQIEIILLGENHYVYSSQILKTKLDLLKRTLVDIEIRPELLDQTSNIILKTDTFRLFVSKSLFLRNLNFIGNDISTKNKFCKETQAICCDEESLTGDFNSSECGLSGLILNETLKTNLMGLINMEFIMELSVPVIPSLKINNCSFKNINPVNEIDAFTSLISTQNNGPFSINIENAYFSLNFFLNGIIYSSFNKRRVIVCFLITENGTIIKLNNNFILDSLVLLYNISTLYFNKVGIRSQNFDNFGNFITIENFRGTILIDDLKMKSSVFSGSIFKISSEGHQSYSNFTMNNVYFSDISSNNLMNVGNFSSITFLNILLTKSVLTSGFSIFSTSISAIGIFIYESLLPSDTLFELNKANLTLNQLNIKNAKSPSPDYYLIESRSSINGPIDAFIDIPIIQVPPITNDRIIIANSVLENGNYLLFTYENAVFSVELCNITIRFIITKSFQPFIDILCEKELSVANSTFELLNLNGKFVYCKFGKNLTFFGCLLSNTQFSAGFDYFVKANISLNHSKVISNFSKCIFKNIVIIGSVPGPLRFLFYNPYSRGKGFFLAHFENVSFQNITTVDSNLSGVTLMTIGSGHLKISQCAFIDIGNMGIHKFYSRLNDSGVELNSTIYRLHSYKLNFIFNIEADYFVKNLILKNNLISALHEFSSFNTFSFLNVDSFVFSENIIQNIFNTFGNSITVKLKDLNHFKAEGNIFYNNSGSNSVSADFSIETLYSSYTDFQELSKSIEYKAIGLRSSTFILSSKTGSIFINDDSEFVLENCRFLLTDGDIGGCIRAGQKSKLLLKNVSILFSNSLQNGGAIYVINTLLILIQTKIISTKASKLGGAIMFSRDSVVFIHYSLFEFAFSTKGGFLWGDNSSVVIQNSNFNQSEASLQGGHIFLKESYLEIVNSSLTYGVSLNSGSLYGEEIIFWIENSNLSNSNSSTSVFFFSGVEGKENIFKSSRFFDNDAASGSCFYALDLNLKMEDCILRNNSASPNSVINIFYSTRNTSLLISNSLFQNNRGLKSLLQSSSTIIQIEGSLFINNFLAGQLLNLKNAILVSKKSVFKVSHSQRSPYFYLYFITIERSSSTLISNNVFDGGFTGGHLKIIYSKSINISNCLFENGYSDSKVGLSLFYESSLFVYGSYFFNNTGLSGTIEIKNSFMMMEASSFVNNSDSRLGSDLSIWSTGQKKGLYNTSIAGAFFKYFKPLSIDVQNCIIFKLERSYFLGLRKAEIKSSGIKLEQVTKFSIMKTLMMDFFEESGISGTNLIASTLIEFTLFNMIFLNSKTITDGAFVFLTGHISLSIVSCYFFRGFTELNGGGIAYLCDPPACCIVINGTTIFEENNSGKNGHSVYSPMSKIVLATEVKIFASGFRSEFYSIPSGLLVFLNLSSYEELKTIAFSLSNQSYLNMNSSDQGSYLHLKGGEKFAFGAILLDEFGNIQTTHSNEYVYLKSKSFDEKLEIKNNYAAIKEGLAFFDDVSVFAKLNSSHRPVVDYSLNEIHLYKELLIDLKVCSKGETLIGGACIDCPAGTFSLSYFLNIDSIPECMNCPSKASCLGGDRIIPEYGYYRFSENSTVIKICEFSEACPYQESWTLRTDIDFICGEGYWGNLCKICAPYYGQSNKGCVSCDNLWKNIVFALKVTRAIAFTFLECHMTLTRIASPEKALMKIFFFHGTYLTIIRGDKVEISEGIKEVIDQLENVFSVTSQDILDLECFLYPYLNFDDVYPASLSIKLSSILTFSIFFFTLYTIFKLVCVYLKNKKFSITLMKNLIANSNENFIIIILITFRNFYRQTLLNTMILFKCEELSDDQVRFVSDNPNIECWGKRHFQYLLGVTITGVVIWSFVFQLIVFSYTYRHTKKSPKENRNQNVTSIRNRINSETKNNQGVVKTKRIQNWKTLTNIISDTGNKEESKTENFLLLFLTNDYKKKFFYWINIEYISIFFLVFVSQITSDLNGNIRKMILFTTFSCLYFIYKTKSPMALKVHSEMIKFSLIVCIISLLSQIIASEKNTKESTKTGVQIFVTVSNGAFYIVDILLIAKYRFAKIRTMLSLFTFFSSKKRRKVMGVK